MREISTAMAIGTPAPPVWDVLLDFARYPQWNPFLPKIEGEARVGARIRFIFELPRGFRMKATAVILAVDAPHELRWAGVFFTRWLLRAEHYFLLRPDGDGYTRFEHGERFTGLLVPLLWPVLRGKGRQVYVDMNDALRARVEAKSSP